MRLPDRLRRVWRWAASLVGASPTASPARRRQVVATPSSSPTPRRPHHPPAPPPNDSSVLTSGVVLVRLWTVGGLVVLATGDSEARRALASMTGDADPEVRREAGRLLASLESERAAA